VQEVDRYKTLKAADRQRIETARAEAAKHGEKLAERGLSNSSINHTLKVLAQVLEAAVEYGYIASNPAVGKRRRLKAGKPARPWVEPEQLMALLESPSSDVGRVLLALLVGTGLRIGEALALRFRDVDLGTSTIYVRDAKTAKGVREVHLTPALRRELLVWAAKARQTAASDHVIQTSTGRRHNASNLRRDVLFPAVATANENLAETGIVPIGEITFHSLRRTYASLRCACGDDLRYTADQLGHEDPRFTLRAYAQATKRRDRLAKPQREAYDAAIEWARMGTSEASVESPFQLEATQRPD
jgi:integrase